MCFSKKKISPSGIVHEPNTSRYKVGLIASEVVFCGDIDVGWLRSASVLTPMLVTWVFKEFDLFRHQHPKYPIK